MTTQADRKSQQGNAWRLTREKYGRTGCAACAAP
jgi:hypothetical protein